MRINVNPFMCNIYDWFLKRDFLYIFTLHTTHIHVHRQILFSFGVYINFYHVH